MDLAILEAGLQQSGELWPSPELWDRAYHLELPKERTREEKRAIRALKVRAPGCEQCAEDCWIRDRETAY